MTERGRERGRERGKQGVREEFSWGREGEIEGKIERVVQVCKAGGQGIRLQVVASLIGGV